MDSLDVLFEVLGGVTFSLEVDLVDSILEIKQKIENYRGIPVSKQTLMFHNVVLEDENIIYNELAQDARLTLVIPPELQSRFVMPPPPPVAREKPTGLNKFRVRVKTQCGATANVSLNPSKVEKVDNFPLPQDGYFFIHKQEVMDEGMTLSWHMVNNRDTIEVFPGKFTGGDVSKTRKF